MKYAIIILSLALLIPFSSAYASWHWSSDVKVCGSEVIPKEQTCQLSQEKTSSEQEFRTFAIDDNSSLLYMLSNDSQIVDVIIDDETPSMIIQVASIADGQIQFVMPDVLLEPGYFPACQNYQLFFLVDGQEAQYTATQIQDGLLVSIQFAQNNSEIEFVGSGTPEGLQLKEQCIRNEIQKLPPRIQTDYVDANDVLCKENMELVFKPSSNEPSCVTANTAEKLIQRGWLETLS